MTPTTCDDYIVLHHRDRLAADGTPALVERFLTLLDRPSRPDTARPLYIKLRLSPTWRDPVGCKLTGMRAVRKG